MIRPPERGREDSSLCLEYLIARFRDDGLLRSGSRFEQLAAQPDLARVLSRAKNVIQGDPPNAYFPDDIAGATTQSFDTAGVVEVQCNNSTGYGLRRVSIGAERKQKK
jgi:hypothetical protein